MKKLKRNTRNIIIASLALLVVVALFLLTTYKNPFVKQEAASPSTPSLPPIFKADAKDILGLALSDADGKLQYEFARTGDKGIDLVIPKLATPRLNSDYVVNTFEELATITPEALIRDENASTPSDADMGLVKPHLATLKLKDNKQVVFEIGGKSASGSTYARIQGENKVWLLPSWSSGGLTRNLKDYRNRDLPSVDPKDLQELRVVNKGQAPIDLQVLSKDEQGFYLASHKIVSPYKRSYPVDADGLNKILGQGFGSFSISDFADDQSLASAGLTQPDYDLLLKDSKGSIHLLIGKKSTTAGNRYAILADDPKFIFQISEGVMDFTRDLKPFSLVSKLPLLVGIDTVSKLKISGLGQETEFSMTRTKKAQPSTADANAKKDDEDTQYFVGGKPLAEDKFKKAYQSIIGIALEGELPKAASFAGKKPMLTVSFTKRDGTTLNYSFVPINNDFAAFVPDAGNSAEFVVSQAQLKNNIEAVLKQLN